VINYVAEKYGRDRLAKIFGRNSTYVETKNAGIDVQARISPLLASSRPRRACRSSGRETSVPPALGCEGARGAALHRASHMLKNSSHWRFDPDQFFLKMLGRGLLLRAKRRVGATDSRWFFRPRVVGQDDVSTT
jgi:hypothetical protein